MTEEEKNILIKEINGYIKENCYYGNGSLKYYDLWLVGWVAEEFNNRKNAMRVLISNEYGLLGNLLYKLAQEPDASITKFIEQTDLEILVDAIDTFGSMSPAVLNHIMVEIFAIVGARTCEVTVIECDAEIQRIYKVRSAKDISYNICGRGGTSFTPVIEYVNSNRYFRDAVLIYFTNGQGERSVPRPLTRRNIWVLYDKYCELSVRKPYGEVLYMNI